VKTPGSLGPGFKKKMNGDDRTNKGAAPVTLKSPHFGETNQISGFFRCSQWQITKDEIKYHFLIANPDTSVLPFIADIMRNPPNTHKYQTVKNRILASFGQSNEVKIRRLLKGQLLGDQKPSHFSQHLKNLASNVCTNDILKCLFLDRMPVRIKEILIASPEAIPIKDITVITAFYPHWISRFHHHHRPRIANFYSFHQFNRFQEDSNNSLPPGCQWNVGIVF